MNIWIVEDDDAHALDAANEAISAVEAVEGISPRSVRLFRNATVHWGTDLFEIGINNQRACLTDDIARVANLAKVAPTIVILDLFDKQEEFTADVFYHSLRAWETENYLPASCVVIWSVRSGKPGVNTFVSNTPRSDHRVCWLDTKALVPLKQAIEGFIRQWGENRYQ